MFVFPGSFQEPTRFQPPPDTRTWAERGADQRSQFAELVASNFRDQQYVQASNNMKEARFAAYDARIAEVEAATGVKMKRPWDVEVEFDKGPNVQAFNAELMELAKRFPDKADVIRAHEPVDVDVMRLQRATAKRLQEADANARDLSGFHQMTAAFLGAGAASFRDPVNLATMAVKGQMFAAKTIYGKVAQQVVTEGALNGGAEAVVQLASEDAKRKAGLPTDGFWKNVGLAAAFGGGLGGLAEGAGHVLAKTGRATPDTDAALSRMAAGDVAEADLRTMADAMGVKLDDGDMAAFTRAVDSDADTAAVLVPGLDAREVDDMARAMTEGSRPPGLRDEVADYRVNTSVKLTEMLDQGNQPATPVNQGLSPQAPPQIPLEGNRSLQLRDDPSFTSYVAEQNAAKLQRLEDWVALNEADISHLVDDGPLDALPSERDFSSMRAASDEDRAARVITELRGKVEAGRRQIAEGASFSVDDVGLQKRFADERGPRQVLPAPLREAKLGEVNSVAAQQQAAESFKASGGMKPTARAKPDDFVKRDTLDILDALPAGTDVNGNPIVTTHAEMSDWAARMDDLADVIAACRAN